MPIARLLLQVIPPSESFFSEELTLKWSRLIMFGVEDKECPLIINKDLIALVVVMAKEFGIEKFLRK